MEVENMSFVSTKGRYGLRVMIDLAKNNTGEYIPLNDIAKRQAISEKYLESIVGTLSRNGLLISLRGKGGGYKLAKCPEEYTILEILKCIEGPLAPITCLEKEVNDCPRAAECNTLSMWEDFYKMVKDFFGSRTLADLVIEPGCSDFVI